MSDSDGVTGIAIYDGSTNIIDPAQGESGFVLNGLPTTENGVTTYVFTPLGNLQDIALSLTVKAVDAQGNESIAGTTIAYTAGLEAFASQVEQAIIDLQGQITSNDGDIVALAGRATSLEAAVALLNASDLTEGSVAFDIAALNTSLTGVINTLAARLDADIIDLQGQITSNDGDIVALAGRATSLEAAVALLNASDLTEGSVAFDIAALNTSLTGVINTLAARLDADIKKGDLTPTLSVVGPDLNDSVLDTSEGNLVIRVSLPSVVGLNDTVQLFLGGVVLGTANTLDVNEVDAGFVDFTITQADLGAAGAKAITAKITSGEITSNSSAGVFFTLSATDITAPNTPTLGVIASDNLINKAEHDSVTFLTGSAEANSKITIVFNNGSTDVSTRFVRADEFGNWYLPYSSDDLPVDATYTVSVTATDAAGNVSTPITRSGVIIDSVIPTGLGIDAVATDNIVDAVENGTGFNITGTGEIGATVAISFSGSGHTLAAARLCRILCPGAFRYAIGKRSSNMIANWLLTACHSRTERFHS